MNKISVITINYNDKEGLKKTIDSVVNQSFKDFEFIIIDGGSNDGSVSIIEENKDEISYWVSEPDSGIYNAMNKGIKVATGEYLLFLNSGDWLYADDAIAKVNKFIDGLSDIYYGNAVFKFHKKDKIVKYEKAISFDFFANSSFCHQSTFINKKLFNEIFFYNEDLKIVSDWEFFIYAICIKNVSHKYMDLIVSNYDFGGISSKPENETLKLMEREIVLKKHFPMFIVDYKNRKELNSKRILNVFHIKKFPVAWKIFKGIITIFMFILPKEKKS
jgi:glycosyltransferase involved in cell wall biosynthesis